jgi:predicted MFS family arabinose efflux permease
MTESDARNMSGTSPANDIDEEHEQSPPLPRDDPVYSTFTTAEKRWIVFLVAYAGLFSPLSSFVYYPALYSLARDLHITLTMANLSIPSYIVVSGFAPSLLGNLADGLGGRPLYVGAIMIYTVANVGLATQRSYPALISCLGQGHQAMQ